LLQRRALCALLPAALLLPPAAPAAASTTATVRRGRVLRFPRDHGTHNEAATEWWYATGWTGTPEAPRLGFQLTFFRSSTGLAAASSSRFAARHLLFAHAAVTDLQAGRHLHAQRITRWSGDAGAVQARAADDDTDVHIGDWHLRRGSDGYAARLPGDDFALDLVLQPTQPLLLQGEAGHSRKGPLEHHASHYYRQPQLQVQGTVTLGGQRIALPGRAWLDHEWSDALLAPEAVGWDWMGLNLFDGSALTVFQLRRADGSALWGGGSHRPPGGAVRAFAPDAVRCTAGRRWTSPATQASYPVQWEVDTPAGRFGVRSLLDAQEMDSSGSTGTVYWEGLSEVLDGNGRRVGLGYLEMTGYSGRLQMR
jgi:predicted secreted hydrolase